MARGPQGLLQTFRIHFFQLLYFFIFLVFFFPHASILACGTIDDWIAVYESGEKHKALFQLLDCADNYVTPTDDIALLPIINDALGRDPKTASLGAQVFLNFNHLWGARREPAYADVLRAVTGLNDIKSLKNYHDWMVVIAAGGANMREDASLDGRIITAVKYGMQVKAISKHGEWIKVRPVGPGSVDPRFERMMGYIHESLLVTY